MNDTGAPFSTTGEKTSRQQLSEDVQEGGMNNVATEFAQETSLHAAKNVVSRHRRPIAR
jgi:hypothetical protein